MAVLPFLCDDDLSFLGFFQTESSEKHLEKIAHFLLLDPLDEVLEFALSPGHGQTYLIKTFGCSIHTLVFSSQHRLAIENILGQSSYRDKLTISNFSKSFEKKSNYTKIVFNGFFEPLGDVVFKRFLTVIEHLSSKNKPIKIYFQGILSPSYEKVLQEHFKKECQYSKIYYHRQALSYLADMQERLVGAQEVFGVMMYRSWRLYFSKAHLAMTRWGYLPLSLEITIQPH
jgi:cyclopropane fatty-acyl-phospholipid synthase-like methyltransferase